MATAAILPIATIDVLTSDLFVTRSSRVSGVWLVCTIPSILCHGKCVSPILCVRHTHMSRCFRLWADLLIESHVHVVVVGHVIISIVVRVSKP